MANGEIVAELFNRNHHLLFIIDDSNVAFIHLEGLDVWIVHSREQAASILKDAMRRATGKHRLGELLRSVSLNMRSDPNAPPPIKLDGPAGFLARRALIVYNVHELSRRMDPAYRSGN